MECIEPIIEIRKIPRGVSFRWTISDEAEYANRKEGEDEGLDSSWSFEIEPISSILLGTSVIRKKCSSEIVYVPRTLSVTKDLR